ncbi:MAG TPA: proline dehydrogenase family protein [Cyclobacteriaceae bacterium]
MSNPKLKGIFEDTGTAFSHRSDTELKKLRSLFQIINNPTWVKLGAAATLFAINLRLPIDGIIKNTIFWQFCGGESINDCSQTISYLERGRIKTILDYSVEGEKSEAGFEATLDECLRIVEMAGKSENMPFCVVKLTGLISLELMEKVQSGKTLTRDEKEQFERGKKRVERLCKRSNEANLSLLIDSEESWIQGTIDNITYELIKRYNHNRAVVYNTYQLYRKDMLDNLRDACHEAEQGGYILGAKLVRGAYMQKERDRAKERGYPNPIHDTKEASDKSYNDAMKFCLDHSDIVKMIAGTHNETSCEMLMHWMEDKGLKKDDPSVYFSQLYGMSDNISYILGKEGYNVAKYLPYGPIRKVMPYLFRRAEENTSVAGQSSRELELINKEIKRRKS